MAGIRGNLDFDFSPAAKVFFVTLFLDLVSLYFISRLPPPLF
jgi:hypothetical protein